MSSQLHRFARPFLAATAYAAIACLFAGPVFAQSKSRTTSGTQTKSGSGTRNVATTSGDKGIAVVELFTSQGCSSCPSADVVLRQIESDARSANKSVFVLSFHVDYWNRLGWTDPYSSEAYSKRQRSYASAVGSTRVYTPQMIVNGTSEFNGSNRSKANVAISSSLKTAATVDVKLTAAQTSANQKTTVTYSLKGGSAAGQILNVAVVATPKANRVPRGENSGRSLSHVNVVRAFTRTKITDASGTVTLELPAGFEAANGTVIAYVQNPRNLQITGASSRPLGAS